MSYAINPGDIQNIINYDIVFIDIRNQEQFEDLHIRNFENIPYHLLDISSLPKNKTICTICYSGQMTKNLTEQLRQLGYDAYYIDGGFQAFLNLSNNQYF